MLTSPEVYQARRKSADRNGRKWRQRYMPKLLREQDSKCIYCSAEMEAYRPISDSKERTDITPTLDHIVPLGKGGTNTPDNFIACCYRCNFRKGNKMPLYFIWHHLLGDYK